MSIDYTKPLTFVEIDIPFCVWKEDYGDNYPGGNYKLWQPYTLGNLQSSAHTVINHTFRFHKPSPFYNPTIHGDSRSLIHALNISPQEVEIGINVGRRMSGSVGFTNCLSSDSDYDPHAYDRVAPLNDPFNTGSFFGKLMARQPYIRGYPLRIMRGYVGMVLADFETHHLLIDGTAGDPSSESFTIKFVDSFRGLDDVVAPNPSIGKLTTDITDTATSFTVESGAGGEYPSSGYVNIGKEIMSYTRSGDVFTISRAKYNTEAQAHNSGDLAQWCLEFTPQSVSDILYTLIDEYTSIDASVWITKSEWDDEVDTYIDHNYEALVAKPVKVKELVNELVMQCGLILWPDNINQKIRLEAIKGVSSGAKTFEDRHFYEGTFKRTIQEDKQITDIVTWYSRVNPLKQLSETENYASGAWNVGAITSVPFFDQKSIFSRWIHNYDTAIRTNRLFIERFQLPPDSIEFAIPFDPNNNLSVGEGFFVKSRRFEDAYGNNITKPFRVTSLNPQNGIVKIVAEELRIEIDPQFDLPRTFTITEDVPSGLDLREWHDAFKTTAPKSGDEYLFVINSGVKVSTLETGSWPTGVSITLINNGGIYGKGGRGGAAFNGGAEGGDALTATYALSIDNQGTIAGAGGGGAGASTGFGSVGNGGGGGGAGYPVGAGGAGSLSPNYDGEDGTLTTGGNGYGATMVATGGDGGDLATAGNGEGGGGTGGAAGKCVVGNSFITWIATGTRIGAIT